MDRTPQHALPRRTSREHDVQVNAGMWVRVLRADRIPHIPRAVPPQVGMLGANAPSLAKNMWNIEIEPREVIYPSTTRWGHMISAHYLKHLKNGDYRGSKLHNYIKQEPENLGS